MERSITKKKPWSVRRRAFRIWQQRPHQVTPLSTEQHTCQSCKTVYVGNYCPRCGQSHTVGRFSFKKAFLLFADVWGMGNRGMFHSLRDLVLRPGYMIRDYICGCQSAYFPPFKMFFILATFSLLLSNGIHLTDDAATKEDAEEFDVELKDKAETNDMVKYYFRRGAKAVSHFEKNNPTISSFLLLLFISAPLYLFLKKAPAIQGLTYPEYAVAMIYTANMNSIYNLLAQLMPFPMLSSILRLFAVYMIIVALSQFTGFKKGRILFYLVCTSFISIFCITIIIVSLVLTLMALTGRL